MAEIHETKRDGLIKELKNFINRNKSDMSTTKIWHQRTWRKRGERYGNTAEFVITTEDMLYDSFISPECSTLAQEFREILKKHEAYDEPAYTWMRCIYFKNNAKV